jgi:CrcB protein
MTSSLTWINVVAVAGGGIVGCLMRWLAGVWLNSRWSGFPLGTLFVNCIGGLLIGMALFWFERAPNETLRLLIVTGMLGGFTTFSSYSVESLIMLQRGEMLLALGHTLAHVVGALACAALGFRIAQAVLGQPLSS